MVMVPAVDRAGRRDLRSAGSAGTGIAASAGLMRLRSGDGFEMFDAEADGSLVRLYGHVGRHRHPAGRLGGRRRPGEAPEGRPPGPLHREARRAPSSRQREIHAQIFCTYWHRVQKRKEPREPARPLRGGQVIARPYFGPTTEQRYTSPVSTRVISGLGPAAAARTSSSEVNWRGVNPALKTMRT
jgi:hypothetical protein